MDFQTRRIIKPLEDEENAYSRLKSKTLKGGPLTSRAVLGELSNIPVQQHDTKGKIADTAAEFEKKATISRPALRSYKHVQSKINTGLASKPVESKPLSQIQPRPPLRREESTAGHALRAVATKTKSTSSAAIKERTKVTVKENLIPVQTVTQNNVRKLVIRKTDEGSTNSNGRHVSKLRLSQETNGQISKALKESTQCADKEDLPCLPPDIEDIDAGDENSPILMTVYIRDIYQYLRDLEVKYSVRPDHLSKQQAVTGKMRATLVDWLVEVHIQFNLLLETFHMTVGIIDRYLQEVTDLERSQIQLVGVTAMFIASKYEEIYAPDVGDFVYVTDNAYKKRDIFTCEREIVKKLNFSLGRPLPLHFLRRFVKAANGNAKNHHLAKYFVDLSLVEYSMSHHRPSELAAAAMCLSMFVLSHNSQLKDAWTPTLEYYSEYSYEQVEPIVAKIATIVCNVETSRYKAVAKKYQSSSLARVSALPELKNPIMKEIANMGQT